MAELPPFPNIPDALEDKVPCILCHRLTEKEQQKIFRLLDDDWQRAENNSRRLGLLKFKHTQWLPEARLTLGHLYRLGVYLNSKTVITWIALDALSGRVNTVILAQYEPQANDLQLGRLVASEAATKLSEVINGSKALKDVVENSKVTVLRDFDLPYGYKDTIPRLPSPIENLPKVSMSGEHSDRKVMVVALSFFGLDDREKLQRICDDKVQPKFSGIDFVHWQNDHTATRTDIFNILFKASPWEHDGAMVEDRYVLFLDDIAGQKEEIIVARATKYNSEGTWDSDRLVVLFRAPMNEMSSMWEAIRSHESTAERLDAEHLAMDKSTQEELRSPDAEFGRRKPVFLPQEEPEGGAPALFFLKSDFTIAEKETVMDELIVQAQNYFGNDDGQHYCLVPWTGQEEGTAEDIVKIVAYLTVNAKWEARYPIFVDSQTARDRSVIMAQWEDDEDGIDPVSKEYASIDGYDGKPGYKQIQWGRIAGREAHINWVGLDVANQSFDGETIEVEEMQIAVKSDAEIEELADHVVLPEDEGDWREIWDAYAAQHMKDTDERADAEEVEKEQENDGRESDDGGEGPSRKKSKK